MIGLFVESNHYIDKITRKHKILGITKIDGNFLKLKNKDGKETSIKDYFEETYNIKIKFLNLRCLILSPGNTNYMPMELCFIAQNQVVRENHPYNLNDRKILYPSTRIQKIANFVKEMNKSQRYLKFKVYNIMITLYIRYHLNFVYYIISFFYVAI